ncbi:hypothetical protein FIV42_09735 [Persicimonas caeni]|uniref:Uncharacterized protein n=1 Tax=Persicimonas caeni TaxID=2292766 RepID=A0A4Y6PRQ7_PERCE|nr:hypothetical protein [Persicimonas caeni]QDG51006.1 hypothetical protein FIV42_09735 [Persicimonas caeni]QED32227.1 hypothetical protein FRD00_09730 [Persicimonas caeni]
MVFEFEVPYSPYATEATLAVGSRQRIAVKTQDSHDRALEAPSVRIERVVSSEPGVISVDSVEQNSFVVRAHAPGDVQLSVMSTVSTSGQTTVSDSLRVSAADATSARVSHGCPFEDAPAYLTRSTVDLRYTLLDGHTTLLGYGHYPVEVEGDTDASIVREVDEVGVLRVRTSRQAGALSLVAEDGEPLLEIAQVDEAQIERVEVGEPQSVAFRDELNFRPKLFTTQHRLCQAFPSAAVLTSTPDVCSARIVEDDASSSRLRVNVAIAAEGDCAWSLSLPNARQGEGLVSSHSFRVTRSGETQ